MTASNAEQDEQSTDSVFDFLYYDSRRIGSFLAQFDPAGHLQQVTHSDSVSKGVKRGFSVKLNASLPIPGALEGAEGGLTVGREPGQTGSEGSSRVYDPLWGNARAFLDYVDERDLIKRDLGNANLGQIVMASGELSVVDTQTLGKLFALPSVKNQLNMNRPKNKANPHSTAGGDSILEIFSVLPHSLQARMKSHGRLVWSCLRDDSFVGLPSDLLLKYGATVTGEWIMLGILDAKPDQGATVTTDPNLVNKIQTEGLVSTLSALGPFARMALGRPNEAFGVTPLLIFREVGA